jgi:hypothetical protein
VGDNARIGAGAVVVRPVPTGATVVSLAAHVVERSCPAESGAFTRLGEPRRQPDQTLVVPAVPRPRRRVSLVFSSPMGETTRSAQTVSGGYHAHQG